MVPRTLSRGVVPQGPHAGTAEGVPCLTSARVRRTSPHTLRSLLPAGRLGHSVGVRQRYGPMCSPVPATDRSELPMPATWLNRALGPSW